MDKEAGSETKIADLMKKPFKPILSIFDGWFSGGTAGVLVNGALDFRFDNF